MCLDYPDLSKDKSFKANLGVNFNKDSQFTNLLELSNLQKKGAFVNSLSELKVKEGDEEKPYFDKDFLISRFLGLTPDQVRINKEYKEREEKAASKSKEKEGEKAEEGTAAPEIKL